MPAAPHDAIGALLDQRPLGDLSAADFDSFLYRSRMCPSRSRFMPGNAEWLAPRRDITVRVALESLRERMQQAAACAELVARLERDYLDEDTLSDDDEALVVAAAIRDNLREALGLLGVVEYGLQRVAQDIQADGGQADGGVDIREGGSVRGKATTTAANANAGAMAAAMAAAITAANSTAPGSGHDHPHPWVAEEPAARYRVLRLAA